MSGVNNIIVLLALFYLNDLDVHVPGRGWGERQPWRRSCTAEPFCRLGTWADTAVFVLRSRLSSTQILQVRACEPPTSHNMLHHRSNDQYSVEIGCVCEAQFYKSCKASTMFMNCGLHTAAVLYCPV
jgi:hypothetical protein